MVLDIVVNKTNDGYRAEIPSLKGCESWAADEDTVLDKIIDLAGYYLNLNSKEHFKIDKARSVRSRTIYKLVFYK